MSVAWQAKYKIFRREKVSSRVSNLNSVREYTHKVVLKITIGHFRKRKISPFLKITPAKARIGKCTKRVKN